MKRLLLLIGLSMVGMLVLAAVAWAQEGANFGNTCDLAFQGRQDPIREPADGHLHEFFGAKTVTNGDTSATLRGTPSTCDRPANSSAYWLPAVYSDGQKLAVDTSKGLGDNTIYYRDGNMDNNNQVTAFPSDFEMIAWEQDGPGDFRWGCENSNYGLQNQPPANCASKGLILNVRFPQCWDKVFKSDASKDPEYVREADGDCNFGDNVDYRAVPMITMSITYVLPSTDVGNISVAGNDADGRVPYTKAHADFMNGWDQSVLTNLVEDCIKNVEDGTPTNQKPDKCQDPRNPN